MKRLDELTNYALVQRYERLQLKWDKAVNALCDAGLGSLKPLDMRDQAFASHNRTKGWLRKQQKSMF